MFNRDHRKSYAHSWLRDYFYILITRRVLYAHYYGHFGLLHLVNSFTDGNKRPNPIVSHDTLLLYVALCTVVHLVNKLCNHE